VTTVLLTAGTGEAPAPADLLAARGLRVIATVTTQAGRRLFESCRTPPDVRVVRFDDESLSRFLAEQRVAVVLNASHPFAVELGRRLIRVCGRLGVPLVRFERPTVAIDGAARVYGDFAAAVADPFLHGRRVMSAIGHRRLSQFAGLHDKVFLVARVLPTVESLRAAEAAGFTADRIVAIRPPVGLELERALIRRYAIDTLLAKESGVAGGQDVKQTLAAEPGGPALLLVRRPEIEYAAVYRDPAAAADACALLAAGRGGASIGT
jgi:precorrin-6A/cobalt-precorrin-6A reductase